MSSSGEQAELFKQMTIGTIFRKVERLDTEALLELLGHLILQERKIER